MERLTPPYRVVVPGKCFRQETTAFHGQGERLLEGQCARECRRRDLPRTHSDHPADGDASVRQKGTGRPRHGHRPGLAVRSARRRGGHQIGADRGLQEFGAPSQGLLEDRLVNPQELRGFDVHPLGRTRHDRQTGLLFDASRDREGVRALDPAHEGLPRRGHVEVTEG